MEARQALEKLVAIAEQFCAKGQVKTVQECGNGNVNDTFRVTLSRGEDSLPDTSSGENTCFILQRLNTQVFRQPEWVMQNMRIVTEHMEKRLAQTPLETNRRWEVPRVLPAHNNQDFWIDRDGSFWRAISFIERSEALDTITNLTHAQEVGYALGMFQCLISDLPATQLADTLVGFHITPSYLAHYDAVLASEVAPSVVLSSSEVRFCADFITARREWVPILENAKAQGKLPLRPIHGDPKVNNVLMDTTTGQAVTMIDLDTAKPGLIHYDIGDCLRSGCNPLGEETELWEKVEFNLELCREILNGYLALTQAFLTDNDYVYLYDGIRLIAFELGLRFFTDYLAGNIYFKAKSSEHNLLRALVQFKLAESIESQEMLIRKIIQDMR